MVDAIIKSIQDRLSFIITHGPLVHVGEGEPVIKYQEHANEIKLLLEVLKTMESRG